MLIVKLNERIIIKLKQREENKKALALLWNKPCPRLVLRLRIVQPYVPLHE